MTTPAANPYVGPRTFTAAQAHLFFGREAEAAQLLAVVISERLTLFYAQSGAGKSSLLHARLIPNLKAAGILTLPVGRVSGQLLPGVSQVDNIFAFNLMTSLDNGQGDPNRFSRVSLSHFLARLTSRDGRSFYYDEQANPPAVTPTPGPDYVLILDQFEEILTGHTDRWPERAGFFQQLDQAMAADPLLRVVLTLREDYVAGLDPYSQFLAGKLRARFYMQRMGYDAALEAVKNPAEAFGRPFAPSVAESLVDNLRQIKMQGQVKAQLGQYVEPVQLQVVCYQLWENLTEKEPKGLGKPLDSGLEITAADLETLGNVDSALAEFYEGTLRQTLAWFNPNSTPPPSPLSSAEERGSGGEVSELTLRRWFDQELITEAGTRGVVFQGAHDTAGLPNEVVKRLADHYLLRAEMRAGGTWYELVHDRFVEPIQQANREWEARRLQRNPLAAPAAAWGNDPTQLLDGTQLRAAAAYAETHPQDVTEEEQEFLQASLRREAEKQEQARQTSQRRRNLTLVTLMVIVALVGLVVWALQKQAEATQAQAEAERQTAAADKSDATAQAMLYDVRQKTMQLLNVNLVQENPQLAILLALESENITRTQIAANVLAKAPYFFPPLEAILQGHTKPVLSVAWSPKGDQIASASMDNTIIIWDVASHQPVASLNGHKGSVKKVAWSPDGTQLASVSTDATIKIWNVVSQTAVTTLTLVEKDDNERYVRGLAWSPDGKRLASGNQEGNLTIWDLTRNPPTISTLTGHTDAIFNVAWSPDGTQLASASKNGTVIVWNLTTTPPISIPLTSHTAPVESVAWSPDGRQLASVADDRRIIIWDMYSKQHRVLKGHTDPVFDVAWSPDGARLASASFDKTAIVWDAATGEAKYHLRDHTDKLWSIAWSPDGNKLASASTDCTVMVWDMELTQNRTLQDHTDSVLSIAWSPDGSKLASASVDQTVMLRTADFEQHPQRLMGHQDWVIKLAWSPDSSQLASASFDKTVIVWDVATGKAKYHLRDHPDKLWSVAWSPDGNFIASGAADNTLTIWDAKLARVLKKFLVLMFSVVTPVIDCYQFIDGE